MKRCARCGLDRPIADFGKQKTTADGLKSWCRSCFSTYEHGRRVATKDITNAKARARRHLEFAQANARTKRRNRTRREAALRALGGVCTCCGEHRVEFLCLDHINGGGNAHRRTFKNTAAYRNWQVTEGPSSGMLRILCHTCNSARGLYGYCPHEREADSAAG